MNDDGSKDDAKEILTLREVAQRLRCSKAHVSKLLSGRVRGRASADSHCDGPAQGSQA